MIKKTIEENKLTLSCEVFPPKKDDDFAKVFQVLDRIAALSPDFISVTYGAGGSNAGKNVEIASYIKNNCHIESLAHMTSVGYSREKLKEGLAELRSHGIENVLALRGDRPKAMTDEEYNSREFEHASDMVSFIKEQGDFTVAGACYPEKHFEAPDMLTDLQNLKKKVNAGCDFLISQLFFDNEYFYRLVDNARKIGINTHIDAGIMPITSAKQLGTTVTLSGTSVPKELADIIAKYGENPEDMKKAGLDYAVRQAIDLADHDVDGIHVYAMNKPEYVEEIFAAIR